MISLERGIQLKINSTGCSKNTIRTLITLSQIATMKFISLTTVVLSVAVIVGADDVIGIPCYKADGMGCGTVAIHNNDLPFVYICGPQKTITFYLDCLCDTCCKIEGTIGVCEAP
ncbi:hypothetical protein K503DRAFT_771931 [Rhizopogon vinicolor AM-OR11-026]|uniref:Uncharacterized protein n=1 Tax=Rhizopogon vinicolor AM-OR11-026 TaxID=1314800 RepID=A0A1B7MWK5_9AGAM|nr:hypothetical protein K503DRAFT_771931 [Rhizopogon vinicolor AM-OR11-026]